jgi:Ca-activated chloride channel family protein
MPNPRFASFMVVLLLWAGPGTQQKPGFRTGINTVEVYATVVDREGRLVPDLTRDDFELRDNGKPQPLTVFEAGTQAITIAIMLDESPSLFEVSPRLTDAIMAFAMELDPKDRAALGAFSHYVRFNPQLTDDPVELLRRLEGNAPEFPAGTALWDALSDAVTALEREPGRRVVLVLTDANDNSSLVDPDLVRTRLDREGVMVYAIGIKGQSGLPSRELSGLARTSGGWYFELKPGDELTATFRRVANELHRQYLLGFSPEKLDGQVHALEVKLKPKGLTARARKSYVATPAPRLPAEPLTSSPAPRGRP